MQLEGFSLREQETSQAHINSIGIPQRVEHGIGTVDNIQCVEQVTILASIERHPRY